MTRRVRSVTLGVQMVSNDNDVLERIFRASTNRAPTDEEASALREAAGAIFPELPPALLDALEALAAQREAGALLGEGASWGWLLDFVTTALPGSEMVHEGLRRQLVVPGLPLSLTVGEGASAAWRVGAAPTPKRLTSEEGWRLKLSLDPCLEALVTACEVHCVAGCCGTGAFDVNRASMRRWLAEAGRDAGEAARHELEATLAELSGKREEQVVSYRFNAVWPAGQCEDYLRTWYEALIEALR